MEIHTSGEASGGWLVVGPNRIVCTRHASDPDEARAAAELGDLPVVSVNPDASLGVFDGRPDEVTEQRAQIATQFAGELRCVVCDRLVAFGPEAQ